MDNDKATSQVETIHLNHFLNRKTELLKLDVEGAEYEILKDIEPNLYFVKYLFIEYHSPANQEQILSLILDIIKNSGFRYYIKEAFVSRHPFSEIEEQDSMDLQLNIYCLRK